MKKLFATLSLLFLLPVIVCAAGCKPTEWKEVRGIEYTTEDGSNTITSTFLWEVTHDGYVDWYSDEYQNTPKENDFFRSQTSLFLISKNDNVTYAENRIGKSYLYISGEQGFAEKITFIGYSIKFVKIRFMPDKHIEIDYDGTVTNILPISYEVYYFPN